MRISQVTRCWRVTRTSLIQNLFHMSIRLHARVSITGYPLQLLRRFDKTPPPSSALTVLYQALFHFGMNWVQGGTLYSATEYQDVKYGTNYQMAL